MGHRGWAAGPRPRGAVRESEVEEGGEFVQVRGGDPLVEVHRRRGSPMDGGGFARQVRRICLEVLGVVSLRLLV